MNEVEEFDAWASKLGLRYISAKELRAKCQNKLNTIPPQNLWGNIVLTAHLVDCVRDFYGLPVSVHSTYRSPAYNKKIGGEKFSLHMAFRAIDFSVSGVDPSDVFGLLSKWRRAGLWKGGLGQYPSFVHVDTRGSNATW